MSTTPDPAAIRDDPEHHRYVLEAGDEVAELVYDIADGTMFLLHTGVPEAFQGHGIAGRLVAAAVDRAAADHLTIVPWCPYARRWLREHPDAAAAVTIDWKAQPR